jgi:hypothetical protein
MSRAAAGAEVAAELNAARQSLRGFLDKIVIPPGEGLLQVLGNVGSMLAAAQGRTMKSASRDDFAARPPALRGAR